MTLAKLVGGATATVLIGLLMPALLAAQVGSQRRDPVNGIVYVRVLLDDGSFGVVRVTPADRINADVIPEVTKLGGGAWKYRFLVRVRAGSTQRLMFFEVPCPEGAVIHNIQGLGFTAREGTWHAVTRQQLTGDRSICEATGPELSPGDSLVVTFESANLPGFDALHAIGDAPDAVWPCGECASDPRNRPARAVIDSLDGTRGGWAVVQSLSPRRPPSAASTPIETLHLLNGDLAYACGPLAAIGPSGICQSLQAKLNAMDASLTRGQASATAGALGAFAVELDALRGEHITASAYAVLSVLTTHLRDQLSP
ncbi:MAG: hypothetical protein ACYC7F_02995 [Gemmatimonadaceae bacterium]